MSLCKFRHIFGKEGEGVHAIRLLDIAVLDLFFTVLAACLISFFTGWHAITVLITLLILGILLHRVFCVNTTVNKAIFGDVLTTTNPQIS